MPKTIVYLRKSNKAEKKFMVTIDKKTIHFGASGMSDYTKHKDPERKNRYVTRHKKRENWGKSGIKTPGFWSRWLLWNKPSLGGSKKDISSRFGVVFKSGKPLSVSKTRKSARKSRKARKSARKSRKARKSARKSRKARKSARKSRKSARKSRKARKSARKSRKARKSARKSRKSRKSRKARKSRKSRKSRKARKSRKSPKKYSAKYERCVLAVKSKQPERCSQSSFKGKGCINPWAVCTSKVGRY
jgi:flagellar biosynthesis GTPase FlhF